MRHELLRTTAEHKQTLGDRLILLLGFDMWQEITDDEERLCLKVPRWFPKRWSDRFFNFCVRVFAEMTEEERHA